MNTETEAMQNNNQIPLSEEVQQQDNIQTSLSEKIQHQENSQPSSEDGQNENIPISVTDSGIVNEETLEHPKNASFPIFFSFLGKTIDGIALQLKKTDSSNFLMFRGITIGFLII